MGMSETLKAISDPARREILEMLKEGKKTAGEISKEDISGSLDITNRADNAFSVNRDEETGQTMVSILKNRSDGIQKKQIALNFDVNCKRFTPYGNDLAQYKKYRWEWEKWVNMKQKKKS